MQIRISAESTVDLTKELIAKYNVSVVPFTLTLGDKTAPDGEITPKEIISFVNETGILPKTSAINQFQYTEYFSELLKDNDYIIHFTLSSCISATNNNANMAAEAINAQAGEKKVFVVDSKSLSTGIALLVLYACDLVKEGLSAKDIYEKCLARVPYVQASFILKRVDYLYKGGRCNAMAYFGANLLGIRPQIIVKDGKMVSGKKYKGKYSKGVDRYCSDVLEEFNTPDKTRVFLTYTTADEETIQIAINHLKEAGFKEILITTAGGTITSHCGEDCLGILYINDENK